MSEEEIIEIIEKLQCEYKEQENENKYYDYTVFKAKEYSKGLQGLLDLYNKQKETIKELEEIEEDHRKENGELQEKIKELETIIDLYKNASDNVAEIMQEGILKNYISKDKIKEKIEELLKE